MEPTTRQLVQRAVIPMAQQWERLVELPKERELLLAVIPTERYSERRAVIPTVRYSRQRAVIPMAQQSERLVELPKVRYPVQRAVIPTERWS